MLALSWDRYYEVVRLALLNVRSDSALIAKADSTSTASCDRAGNVCRCVGWDHHLTALMCLPSSIGSRLGGAKIKALKLSSLSVITANSYCHLLKADNSIEES